jgi:hypothetical protein
MRPYLLKSRLFKSSGGIFSKRLPTLRRTQILQYEFCMADKLTEVRLQKHADEQQIALPID